MLEKTIPLPGGKPLPRPAADQPHGGEREFEESPSERLIERRHRPPLTAEDMDREMAMIRALTEETSSASEMDQRRALFRIGGLFAQRKVDKAQRPALLDQMRGFHLDLKGEEFVITRFLDGGSFGAVFELRAAEDPGEERPQRFALKTSIPFNREDMFVEPDADLRRAVKAEKIRGSIAEMAALYRLTHTQRTTNRSLLKRRGGFPPVPLLYAGQFIPSPDPDPLDPERQSPRTRIAALLMELVDGQRIDQAVWEASPGQNPRQLKTLSLKLLKALDYIHTRGVVHGDIKPSNIQLTPQGDVILIDFGSASLQEVTDRQLTQGSERVVWGIREKAIFSARPYTTGLEDSSPAQDLYAAGMVMLRLVFHDEFANTAFRQDHRKDFPHTSQDILKLMEDLIQFNPEHRPSVKQAIERLAQI